MVMTLATLAVGRGLASGWFTAGAPPASVARLLSAEGQATWTPKEGTASCCRAAGGAQAESAMARARATAGKDLKLRFVSVRMFPR